MRTHYEENVREYCKFVCKNQTNKKLIKQQQRVSDNYFDTLGDNALGENAKGKHTSFTHLSVGVRALLALR